jgi:arsenate reductase-like glutaredoxin family protein
VRGWKARKRYTSVIEVVDYFNHPSSAANLKHLSTKLELPLSLKVHKQGAYLKQHLKGKELGQDEWNEVLLAQPQLLHRPIMESAVKATIGHPVENILSTL